MFTGSFNGVGGYFCPPSRPPPGTCVCGPLKGTAHPPPSVIAQTQGCSMAIAHPPLTKTKPKSNTKVKHTMSDIRETMGSNNFLKAADLKGRATVVTIEKNQLEKVGQGDEAKSKNVLYFQGLKKSLVLNVTNADVLIDAFGFETQDWPGSEIELYPTTTDYQGKRVDCIRLRVPEKPALAGGQDVPF